MDKYKIFMYPRAYRDIDGIYTYIAENLKEREIALKMVHSAQASGRWCPVPAATRPRLSGHLISGQIWVQLPQCSAS